MTGETAEDRHRDRAFCVVFMRIGSRTASVGDEVQNVREVFSEVDAHDGRRSFRGTKPKVVLRRRGRETQELRVSVNRPADRRAEDEELEVAFRSVARIEQILSRIRPDGPVIVLSGTIDAGKRLFVQETEESMTPRDLTKELHDEHLVIEREIEEEQQMIDIVKTVKLLENVCRELGVEA